MRTADLISKFKSLTTAQRRQFMRAASAINGSQSVSTAKRRRRVDWPDIEARARRISDGQTLPNLVLLDREKSAF